MRKRFAYILLTIYLCQNVVAKNNVQTTPNSWKDSIVSIVTANRVEMQWREYTETLLDSQTKKIRNTKEEYAATESSIATTHSLDYTKGVGEIPIQAGVSPLGARTYQIPIESYPGLGGLSPQIYLTYNSLSNNGIAGYGWNISGLSSIIRSNKSIYYDGKTEGMFLDNNDAFVLDGQRLIRLPDENDMLCYQTVQGNIKVRAAVANGNVTNFLVYYPDGKVGTYISSDSGHLTYPITKLTDIDGNTITYTYTCSNNYHAIQTISYNTKARIEFIYESRADVTGTYISGEYINNTIRLKSITSKWDVKTLGTYTLSYSMKDGISYLTEIGYHSDNVSLNPLRFEYGNGVINNDYYVNNIYFDRAITVSNPTHNNHLRLLKGRYDYTKSEGILTLANRNPYLLYLDYILGIPLCGIVNQYAEENTFIALNPDLESNISITSSLSFGDGFVDVFCADLDGERHDYIVRVNNVNINGRDQVIFSIYKYYTVSAGPVLMYSRSYDFGGVFSDFSGNQSVRPKYFHIGDFNGDGRQDIMVLVCPIKPFEENASMQCRIYDLAKNQLLYSGTPFNYQPVLLHYNGYNSDEYHNNNERLLVFDYNGDGKSDVCLVNANGTYMYKFNSSGENITSCTQVGHTLGLSKSTLANRSLLLGEFNGDGLIDLLLSPYKNNSDPTWHLYTSKGNGTFAASTFSGTTLANGNCDGVLVQDVNGDGKSDIIKYSINSFHTFLNMNGIPIQDIGVHNMKEYSTIAPTNITTQNSFSHVLTLKGNELVRHTFRNDAGKQRLLTSMTNSFGNSEHTIYKYPFDSSPSYTTTSLEESAYPYVVLKEKIPFVDCSYEIFEGNIQNPQSYGFSNLIVHRQGLGICGMERTHMNGTKFGILREYNPIKNNILIHETTRYTTPITDISETTYEYEVKHPHNDKRVQINVIKKTTTDYLNGFTTTSSYTYNNYGFPTSETVITSDGITVRNNQILEHYNTTNKYLLNIVKEKTVTTEREGLSQIEKIVFPSMLYDKPLEKYCYINGGQVSYESFAYNGKGLMTQKTIRPYSSSNTLTTSYLYDEYGRLQKETDPESLTQEYTYDSWGRVSSYKDKLGNTDTYTYDAFGRKTRTDFANGTWETVNYTWKEGFPFNQHGYTVTTLLKNGKTQISYRDTKHREIGTEYPLAVGGNLMEVKTYDEYNNILTQTLPFKVGATQYHNQYSYDQYNRLTSLTEASGKITTYSYNNNQVTTVKDNMTSTRKYDSQGKLISVVDGTGTITYTYRPDGQLQSATVPGGFTTIIEYDSYGRQTKLIDPCAGTTSFTYDDSGNMIAKTDATGKQTLMGYNSFGRLMYKEHVGMFSTCYIYDQHGQLLLEEDDNGSIRTFEYDRYGRLIQDQQSVADYGIHNLTRLYTYADNGNLASISYSQEDGNSIDYGTELYEYQNGELRKISFQSDFLDNEETTIWQLDWTNEQGIPSSITSGMLSHSYVYNLQALPERIKTTISNTQEDICDFHYRYALQTGNVILRGESVLGVNDAFGYDSQNRLVRDDNATFEYDNELGNITYNSRIGTLTYGGRVKADYWLTALDPMTKTSTVDYLSNKQQTMTYNALSLPESITENGYTTEFTYNGRGERIQSYFYKEEMNSPVEGVVRIDLENKYYLGNIYERHIDNNDERIILYLGGDAYSSPAAFVLDNQYGPHISYICRDHLGSITNLVSEHYTKKYSYDAWGNMRSPYDGELYFPGLGMHDHLYLGRGYTGHEHLGYYGLINMNARLYEPILGRFLSPDPFVQMPDYSQNFNRYAYCLNNPLKYTDASGEFIFSIINAAKDLFMNTFIRVWDQGFNAWSNSENWHSTQMAFKIDLGLFKGDFKQIVSRFTWELPQNILGYGLAQAHNLFNDVKSVTYYGGATAVERYSRPDFGNEYGSAITLGSYISGKRGLQADPYNPLFQHEYGHYLQSQSWGLMYLGKVGIPSALSAWLSDSGEHLYNPIEQDANARAFEYFSKNVKGFYNRDKRVSGWDFNRHPIDITGNQSKGVYIDYATQLDDVRKLRLSIKPIEYIMLDQISLGLYNHIRYSKIENRRKKW